MKKKSCVFPSNKLTKYAFNVFIFVELGGCIICVMAEALFAFKETGKLPIESINLNMFYNKHFVPGRQEDAHEFLCCLMQAMDEAHLSRIPKKQLNYNSKETTPIKQIFGGYLGTSIMCLKCGYKSMSTQYFQGLLMDIKSANTLENSLNLYFDKEVLNMGYKCISCNKNISATKQFCLEQAPTSLCIQMKRYSADGKKLHKRVKIPQYLDLSTYSSRMSTATPLIYRLTSLITHSGHSTHSGHYEAICLNETGSHHRFNGSSDHETNGYILFYELHASTN